MEAKVSQAPGDNDMPSKLTISVSANNSATPTDIVEITSASLQVNGPIRGDKLTQGSVADGYTLVASDSGTTIFQSNGGVTINLPEVIAGFTIEIIQHGAAGNTITIAPPSNRRLSGSILKHDGTVVSGANNGMSTNGKKLLLGSSSKVGDRVRIIGFATRWYVAGGIGDFSWEA